MRLIDRDIVKKIIPWLNKPDIIVLLGARQVGKTSIMRLLMERIPRGEHVYFDLEDTYNLEALSSVDKFLSAIKAMGLNAKKPIKVFIDEVQYLPEPSKFLKLIHDHHPEIKLIVSGSSSFDIRKKFSDHLTGRKVVFEIYPLSFNEYLRFKNSPYQKIKSSVNLKEILRNFNKVKGLESITPKLLQTFEEFIVFGGYPLPVLSDKYDEKILRLKEIHNTYIQKDIKDIAHIENIFKFNKLVSYLSVQISNLLNINEVSKEVSVSRRDVERYLSILEKTFVLSLVKPFYQNRQKEITKMSKMYFNDTGLRNININDLRPLEMRTDKGALVENAFLQEFLKNKGYLDELHFWRTKDKQEVDFVLIENREVLPIEVKYQRFDSPNILSGIRSFIDKHSPENAVIVTKNYLAMTKFIKTKVFFVPMWMI